MGGAQSAMFQQAAAAGELGIDPDAAQTVLSRIRAGRDAVEELIARASDVDTPPRLGANPVGEAMSAKYADRAGGHGDSYLQALRNLHAQYDQVEQGIQTAIRTYADTDADAASALNRKL